MDDEERGVNLHDEIREFKDILHIHVQTLSDHIEYFKQHELAEHENYSQLLIKISSLCINTQGLVELWNAGEGTIKTLSVIGSIIKWVSGIAVATGSIWFMFHGQLPSGK
jgi:hypothetical protein